MRKHFLYLFLSLVIVQTINAQTRGTKVGYIDMEYILQNVPDYTEATIQLEQKAQKWKQEIESKKVELNKIKEALKAEKALLTKELIDERETEITFLENEMLEYQQKRFGAKGDLMLQKSILAMPIQDQVFTAIQDIAVARKYDFIFDKSSDLTMLFADKRFDISEQVLRVLNRSEKREQLTKKQLKEEELKENREDALDENPIVAERQKALDDKKTSREKILADRKLLQEQKKKEFDDKRKQIQADREAKKNGTVSANVKLEDSSKAQISTDSNKINANETVEKLKQNQADAKTQTVEERKKIIEERKKALEEKRKKILEEREAIKKAKEEKLKENKNNN
ncbi:MAG: OmpH family outer membrane protein [Flavobacterium sp.]|mgnify:CR=1 FL=1|jgi:Skp family chaperone for outer membrane proteins|uniref:OmpH family outer membrane protein n=1 Tax=Flavobacterium sp. TaxID=239 RepID=UPI001B4C4A5C|nr:OmpH family outer membrane protein [Flavobacterium sp.]MBP7183596.1 OmpH family outer membrane protein [Flavobacterium sp.]MBP7317445.1 OmpH family outer membrane protein [Flavobacterium sp.]